MTYREHVQQMLADLDTLYTRSERLRDLSTLSDQDIWNSFRLITGKAGELLARLDNGLPMSRALVEIDND